ncbi:hypothetical protein DPMN_037611 [Dreissena polymorpha]|uniref:Uncharacterized protein n=1 Tax=Dreissena polymorpha TaxID=45954 RepID=A0A9D4MDV0_DREPO|nr:hypothetical protein DPMN_037611 [Dreissena polymorpha]
MKIQGLVTLEEMKASNPSLTLCNSQIQFTVNQSTHPAQFSDTVHCTPINSPCAVLGYSSPHTNQLTLHSSLIQFTAHQSTHPEQISDTVHRTPINSPCAVLGYSSPHTNQLTLRSSLIQFTTHH